MPLDRLVREAVMDRLKHVMIEVAAGYCVVRVEDAHIYMRPGQ